MLNDGFGKKGPQASGLDPIFSLGIGIISSLSSSGRTDNTLKNKGFPSKNKRKEVRNMAKKGMSQKAASRIQSHADRSGSNQGFKARAQRAASKSKK